MVATWNPAADAAYYMREAQASYYVGGREPPGVWYAPSGSFGLVDGDPVDARAFEHLFAGRDAAGRPVVAASGRAKRVGAFDLTFSAPRSVALLWALADDATRTAIEAAQARAVRAALKLLQREAAFARRGKAGRSIEPVALTAACFQHGESRPAEHADGRVFADMNLHTHAVVINIAARADGTVGALHSVVLRNAKLLGGAAYHAQLAAELQAVGFALDRVGRNGLCEIAGIDDDSIRYFSARRTEIEAELAETGTTSGQAGALAAGIARATRAAKVAADRPRADVWREAAARIGLDLAPVLAEQRQRGVAIDKAAGERLLAERLAALPRALTETQSVLERREVVRATAEALVGTGLGAERIEPAVDALLRDGHVVELSHDPLGLPRYSTSEMIWVEREAAAMAERLVRKPGIGLDPAGVRTRAEAHGLSAEQLGAALSATSPARLTVVEGAPGTGKTTMLRPVVEAWRAAGYCVVGAASAWRVANALRVDLGVESRATASWLARQDAGLPFLDATSVLVLDEAGLIGSREMHALLAAVEMANARLIAVGDRGQLQNIGAGSGLSILTRSTEAARVTTIVRQREAWAREAVARFGCGNAVEALDAFAECGRLVEADGARAAINAAVDAVEPDLLGAAPDTVLIVAKTNAEAAAVGQEVRRRLRERGLLRGEDVAIDATTPSGHPAPIGLAPGDRVRFLARHDAIGVVNGTVGTVTHVSAAEPGEKVAGASPRHANVKAVIEGRHVSFHTRDLADAYGRARLGLAYCSTIYGAQGMTVERAAVLLTSRFDRHDVYVAASRARDATTLVVDRRALEREMGATEAAFDPPVPPRSVARVTALGKPQGSATPRRAAQSRSRTLEASDAVAASVRRRVFLASRLATAHVKETTLDLVAPPDLGQLPAAPQRWRDRTPAVARRKSAERSVALPDSSVADGAQHSGRRREHGLEL